MSMKLSVCGLGVLLTTLSVGCTARPSESPVPDRSTPHYEPTATIKDLMDSIVDPAADVVWGSVTTVSDGSGVLEKAPHSDAEWFDVRLGALRLVEASNLLLVPGRRAAAPGERSEAPGDELEPEEIDALMAKDRAGWNKRAKDLHDAALEALNAINAKNPQGIFEVGERIERACENCHTQYWYPNQRLPPGYGEAR